MSSISSELPPGGEHQPFSGVASAKPFNSSHRIQSLDVLRGIAVLGALFVSIWIFGGFSTNQQNGLLIQSKGLNYRLFGTVNLLLEGKMRALISIVFGASMLLFLFKGTQRGQLHNADLFIRRQMWLIAFGLINALVFLWSGDLLFHLGVMGILLFAFVRLSARGLLIAAILTTLIYCGKNYWRYADDRKVYNKYLAVIAVEKKIAKDSLNKSQKNTLGKDVKKDSLSKEQKKDTLTKKQKEEKQAWEGLIKNMKYDPKKDEPHTKAIRTTSYGKLWNYQLRGIQTRQAQWTYRIGIWDLSSMIFLGMALLRFGFFNSRFSTKKYLLLTVIGLSVGLLLGWFRLHYNQVTLQDYTKYITSYVFPHHLFFPFERAFLALGYASLVLFLMEMGMLKRLWQGLAIAGQMALTNYIMQSIICLLFFTGFGMGYFARLQQYQLYVFAGEIVLVNVVFSIVWLRHFHYGPAEWLWRCLIYKRWLPNKILTSDTTEPLSPAIS